MPTTTVVYTNRPDTLSGPLSLRRGGVSRFVLPDLQGHARQLTDSTGAVTDTLTADAWGVPKATSGSTVNPYKAFGQWGYFTDTPSRLYVRARHLRVDLGRWVSRDSRGYSAEGRNAHLFPFEPSYVLAMQNPTTYVDPSGLVPIRFEYNAFIPKRIGSLMYQGKTFVPAGLDFIRQFFTPWTHGHTDERGFTMNAAQGGRQAKVWAWATIDSMAIGVADPETKIKYGPLCVNIE